MIDDGTVWRLGDQKYMFISGAEDDFSWLERNLGAHDVRIENITSDHTTLALQGPDSSAVLGKLTDFNLEIDRLLSFRSGDRSGCRMPCGPHGVYRRVWIRNSFPSALRIQTLERHYARRGGCGDPSLWSSGLESLRQEAGYLLVGNDHDKSTNPLEAGIGFTVKFDKSQFNGKDALVRIAETGVARRMVWFDLPSGVAPKTGDPIFIANRQIGRVTSGSIPHPQTRHSNGLR